MKYAHSLTVYDLDPAALKGVSRFALVHDYTESGYFTRYPGQPDSEVTDELNDAVYSMARADHVRAADILICF